MNKIKKILWFTSREQVERNKTTYYFAFCTFQIARPMSSSLIACQTRPTFIGVFFEYCLAINFAVPAYSTVHYVVTIRNVWKEKKELTGVGIPSQIRHLISWSRRPDVLDWKMIMFEFHKESYRLIWNSWEWFDENKKSGRSDKIVKKGHNCQNYNSHIARP